MIANMYSPFAVYADTFGLPAACLLIVWVFLFGGAVGSFLNVVAYRLPLGMSLSRPASRCPACGRPIRWYHNVPIAGWLVLRGRCADCGAAISPRYPVVELIVAVASAVVAWGAIVPEPPVGGVAMFSADLARIGYQLLLVWTLLCAALLEFDGHLPPVKLLAVVLAIGVAVPVFQPDVRPLWGEEHTDFGLLETLLAAVVALFFGALAWPLLVEGTNRDAIRRAGIRVVELVIAGVFLGLAAVAGISFVAATLFFGTRMAARAWSPAARFAWAASLVAGTLVWFVATSPVLDAWSRLAGAMDPREMLIAAGAAVAVLAVAGRRLRGKVASDSHS